MDINILRYLMEEIYSLRFLKDTQALAKQEDSSESFPVFVGNFLSNKYQKKSMLDQQTINFITSIEFYSRSQKDIKLFSKFLSEEFDVDDLIFYLFVRSCIEKEMKIFFLEKAKENMRNSNNNYEESGTNGIYVPVKSCKKIGLSIFGNEEKELLSAFMDKISNLAEKESLNNKKTMIKATSILIFAVEDYHTSRNEDNDNDIDNDNDYNNSNNKNKNKSEDVSAFETKEESNKPIDKSNNNANTNTNINNTKNNINNSKNNINNTNITTTNKTTNNTANNNIVIPTSARSKEFKQIIARSKIERCRGEAEKKTALKKIVCDYAKEKEIDNYFKNLLNLNPLFEGINPKSKSVVNVKDLTLKKVTVLTNLVFSQDKASFLSFLKLKDGENRGSKGYATLIEYIGKMVKTPKISELNEGFVIMFLKTIFDIPEFNLQTTKLLIKNIE